MEKRGFLVYCAIAYSFLTAQMKYIHLSVEAYHPIKENEGWDSKLLQQEPDHIDIFAYEEKILASLVKKPILRHLQK